MILDSSLELCAFTPVARAAGTALIGSAIDTGIGGNLDTEDLYLTIVAPIPIVAAGAATLRFQLATHPLSSLPFDSQLTVLMQTNAFAIGPTPTPAGAVLYSARLPHDIGVFLPSRRFLGILQVTTGASITGGAISAFLGHAAAPVTALPVAAN